MKNIRHGDVTPMKHSITSDTDEVDADEDIGPEHLDFEGASGVFDHPGARSDAAVHPPQIV